MAKAKLQLSVVIPTRNRRASLVAVLEALDAQDIDAETFEVIAVLNACEDDSAEALSALSAGYSLRTVELGIANAAVARNAGAKAALGSLLVFVDDDIEAVPGFLAAHARAHEGDNRRVVIGYSKPHIPGASFFDVQRRAWWEGVFSWMGKPGHRYGYRDLLSGNFSIRKQTFDGLDGFNESLDCREDYELGLRCLDAGLPLTYAPDAVGWHRDISDFARSFVRARREGEADALIARQWPQVFGHLLSPPPPPGRWIRLTEAWLRVTGREPEKGVLSAGIRLLGLVEQLRFRRAWDRLLGALRAYSYSQGVRATLASGPSPNQPPPQETKDLPSYDLANGLDAVRRRLDADRPHGAVFVHGAERVLTAPLDFASERLAGRHLTRMLQDSPNALAFSYAAQQVMGPLPATPSTRVADLPRRESGITTGEVDTSDWSFDPPFAELTFPARLLVRRGQSLFGWVQLYPGEDTDTCLYWVREAVIAQVWPAILRRSVAESLAADAPIAGGVSVVVCTRDRLQNLKRCLAAIEGLHDPKFEVVVVDNAPSSTATEDYVRQLPWVRYVREDRPGLDWARNRGVAAARFPIVAFTDDDTKVDRHWLSGIRRAFAQDEVMAMTGLVAPMKLDTYAQIYFEDIYGGMGKGFEPRWRRRQHLSQYELLWSSICGVGANMAFRRSLFDTLGGFDPALDVGTPTRGGGDIEFFHRLVANGHTLVYEPSAMIWHEHRTDWAALRGQLRDNGSGFMAYLLACRRAGSVRAGAFWRFLLWSWGCRWLLARLIKPGRHRRQMVVAEITGALAGHTAYAKARRQAARLSLASEDATALGVGDGA